MFLDVVENVNALVSNKVHAARYWRAARAHLTLLAAGRHPAQRRGRRSPDEVPAFRHARCSTARLEFYHPMFVLNLALECRFGMNDKLGMDDKAPAAAAAKKCENVIPHCIALNPF